MTELMKDRYGAPVYVDDYIMYGVRCNSMGDAGQMAIGQVVDKTGHGIKVGDYPWRFKVSHKIVKVDPSFAAMFAHYTR